MQEGTTLSVTAADRPYGEFYDFCSVSLENFGSTLIVACIQTCNLDIMQHTIQQHRTHQYMPQELDPLELKMLRLDYMYVATCIVNKDILNFSQECVNIVIALVFTLYL